MSDDDSKNVPSEHREAAGLVVSASFDIVEVSKNVYDLRIMKHFNLVRNK